jgi:hypothetical protein
MPGARTAIPAPTIPQSVGYCTAFDVPNCAPWRPIGTCAPYRPRPRSASGAIRKAGSINRHELVTARVTMKRNDGRLVVEIEDILSPTVLQRLSLQEGLFRVEITESGRSWTMG